MKYFILALLFVLVPCSGVAVAQDEVLFVGGAPLDSYQPQVIVPLLREAFARNGIRFEAEAYPSARSLVMSNSGEADGELHRVHNFAEVSKGRYPNLMRIEFQLMSVYLSVYSKKSGTISRWKDLKGYDIAFQRGRQNVRAYLENAVGKNDIHPKNTDLTAFYMLAEDRVDYVVAEDFEGQRILQLYPELQGIKAVGRLEETRIYSYINKKHSQLAETIAMTLTDMENDGTYQRIVEDVRASLLAGE